MTGSRDQLLDIRLARRPAVRSGQQDSAGQDPRRGRKIMVRLTRADLCCQPLAQAVARVPRERHDRTATRMRPRGSFPQVRSVQLISSARSPEPCAQVRILLGALFRKPDRLIRRRSQGCDLRKHEQDQISADQARPIRGPGTEILWSAHRNDTAIQTVRLAAISRSTSSAARSDQKEALGLRGLRAWLEQRLARQSHRLVLALQVLPYRADGARPAS
jgi:hypothetical protein